MSYENAEDLGVKMSWEGGPADFIFSYGVSMEDLPADLPTEVRSAFGTLLGSQVKKAMDILDAWGSEYEL